MKTLSDAFAPQAGVSVDGVRPFGLQKKKLMVEATIVAVEGIIIRRQALIDSKILAYLAEGNRLTGEAIVFIHSQEAWLQVTKPVVGWCPIVLDGKTYLSIK